MHKSVRQLYSYLVKPPFNMPDTDMFVQPPQAMPEQYKDADSVIAYRNYYIAEKLKSNDDHIRFATVLSNGYIEEQLNNNLRGIN